jgi:hypothetical protein
MDEYTKILLHCHGPNGSFYIKDDTDLRSWILRTHDVNNCITTATYAFGGSSLQMGGGTSLWSQESADFDYGAGDFTISMFIRFAGIIGIGSVIYYTPGAGTYSPIAIYQLDDKILFYSSSNGASWNIANNVSAGTIAANQWYNLVVNRTGNALSVYLDGVRNISINTAATLMAPTGYIFIGSDYAYNQRFQGWLQEIEISKGIGRYPNEFPPVVSGTDTRSVHFPWRGHDRKVGW